VRLKLCTISSNNHKCSKGLGQYYKSDGLIVLEVRPIQSNLCLFYLNKEARAFERSCTVSQDGAICPIFEGDMRSKNDPKSGAVNGTITKKSC
jgi:hypothetical protein